MYKLVVFTSLTGHYNILPQYPAKSSECDYICFSNDYQPGTKIGIWEIRSIPIKEKDNIRLSRYAKLLPHKVLPEYEWSIWLDANIEITESSFYDLIKSCIEKKQIWSGVQHPVFDCIYDDAKEGLRVGRSHYSEIKKQIEFLRQNNYPRHAGLFENNIILRNHNNPIIKDIDELWWKLYNTYSRRDQMSLFFIFKKYSFTPSLLFPKGSNARNSSMVTYVGHPRSYSSLKHLYKGFSRFFLKIKNRAILKFSNLFEF